jgi:hypothetical protein
MTAHNTNAPRKVASAIAMRQRCLDRSRKAAPAFGFLAERRAQVIGGHAPILAPYPTKIRLAGPGGGK